MAFSVRQSTMNHPLAGCGLFAMRNIGSGDTVLNYYGSLVYSNFSGMPQKHRTYGEGDMAVTVQYLDRWAVKLTQNVHPINYNL